MKSVGLCVSGSRPWIGASPDGLLLDDVGGLRGVLEVKCLYSQRNRRVRLTDVRFLTQSEPGAFRLRPEHRYYSQVQLQMFVTGC